MILDHKKFDANNKMIFEKVKLKPPFRPPSHFLNEACFIYIINGEHQTIAPLHTVRVKSKDAILLKCGLYFTTWMESSVVDECEAIAVHLYPEILKWVYGNEMPAFIKELPKTRDTQTTLTVSGDELVSSYFQSLLFYFDNPALVDDELIKLKLKELILILSKTEKVNSIADVIASLFSPREYSFREVIEANLYTSLSTGELAKFTNRSLSSFKREFERIYNDPPARYLKNKKLEKAAALLSGTGLQISEIAFQCGFSDSSHLSRSFTEKYNISPSAYRVNLNKKLSD